jgi:hypothetical protein
MTELPFIDEHSVLVPAPAVRVWESLLGYVGRGGAGGGGALASVLGAEPRRASASFGSVGTTVPGFAVARAVAGERLELTGRHHFSRYALVFLLAPESGGTRLTARTQALFPGPHGWVYRQFVIGSRAHRVLVRRMLDAVRRHATLDGGPQSSEIHRR